MKPIMLVLPLMAFTAAAHAQPDPGLPDMPGQREAIAARMEELGIGDEPAICDLASLRDVAYAFDLLCTLPWN